MSELTGLHNKLVPRSFDDLRGWDRIAEAGGRTPGNRRRGGLGLRAWNHRRKAFGNGDGPALLFNSVKGYGPGDDVWSRKVFTGGLSNYRRVAMALGLPKDAPVRDMVMATRHYLGSGSRRSKSARERSRRTSSPARTSTSTRSRCRAGIARTAAATSTPTRRR